MGAKETWYLCAPEKNRGCRKRNCYRDGGGCMMTSSRAAAVRAGNGRAILMIVRRSWQGFKREIRIEEDGIRIRKEK